jgi:hypothetical protein
MVVEAAARAIIAGALRADTPGGVMFTETGGIAQTGRASVMRACWTAVMTVSFAALGWVMTPPRLASTKGRRPNNGDAASCRNTVDARDTKVRTPLFLTPRLDHFGVVEILGTSRPTRELRAGLMVRRTSLDLPILRSLPDAGAGPSRGRADGLAELARPNFTNPLAPSGRAR